jgi:hypothetical protein
MHILLHNMGDGSIIAVTIMDRMIPGRAEATSQSFVDELNKAVWAGGEDSLRALEELSGIAMGGHQEAKEFINAIDDAVGAGELVLVSPPEQTKSSSKFNSVLFIATHPVLSARAKLRQIAVSIEHQAPPHTSTWEEFPNLSVYEAAKALRDTEERLGGGVPKNAWPETDQKLMKKGEKPKGYPEHPNV